MQSLVFGTRSPQVSLSSPFPFPFLLFLSYHLFIDQERDLEQVQAAPQVLLGLKYFENLLKNKFDCKKMLILLLQHAAFENGHT